MMRRWRRRRPRPVPWADVRVTQLNGHALPVRYERGAPLARHTWTAIVRVPASRHDVTVSVDVRSPRTAVRLETGW